MGAARPLCLDPGSEGIAHPSHGELAQELRQSEIIMFHLGRLTGNNARESPPKILSSKKLCIKEPFCKIREGLLELD